MTVQELIEQLQQCDKPDATVRIQFRSATMPATSSEKITDVYYDSVADNEVNIEAEVK